MSHFSVFPKTYLDGLWLFWPLLGCSGPFFVSCLVLVSHVLIYLHFCQDLWTPQCLFAPAAFMLHVLVSPMW